jgi:hypothetical protein
VRDLSGENPVTIGGQTFTISTRYSDAMFPTPRPTRMPPSTCSTAAPAGAIPACARATPPPTPDVACRRGLAERGLHAPRPGGLRTAPAGAVRHPLRLAVLQHRGEPHYAPGADDAISGERRCSRRCACSGTTASATR